MTNILNQGSSDQFSRLGAEGQIMSERYEKLFNLVLEQDLVIAASLCEIAPMDDMEDIASLFFRLLEPSGVFAKLLKRVIESEVAKTESPTTLFRRNSIATKMLTHYTKISWYHMKRILIYLTSRDYLIETLRPLITELVSGNLRHCKFEMDPTRISPNESLDDNMNILITVTQKFVDSIIMEGTGGMPIHMREICAAISKEVRQRFPESRLTAVGGFGITDLS